LVATYPELASHLGPLFQSLLKLIKAYHTYRLLIVEDLVLKHLSQTPDLQTVVSERSGRSLDDTIKILFPVERKAIAEIINDPKKFRLESFWGSMAHFLSIQPSSSFASNINNNTNNSMITATFNNMTIQHSPQDGLGLGAYTTLITGPVTMDPNITITSNGVLLPDVSNITNTNTNSTTNHPDGVSISGTSVGSSMEEGDAGNNQTQQNLLEPLNSAHFGGSGLSTDEFLDFLDLARYSRDPSGTGLSGGGGGGGGFLNMYGVSEELPGYMEIEAEGVGNGSSVGSDHGY
jgi:hypothetical protein